MSVDRVFYLLGALALVGAGVLGVIGWRTHAARRGWVSWDGRVAPRERGERTQVEWRAPDGTTHRMAWGHAFLEPGTPVPLKVEPTSWSRAQADTLLSGGGVYALAACLVAAVGVMFIGFGGMVGSFISTEKGL